MDMLVELKNLSIVYRLKKNPLRALASVSLPIQRGKITALVGESGSGKSTLAASLLECLSTPGEIEAGQIVYHGHETPVDIREMDLRELNGYRWKEVSMVFQGAQSALNPTMTVLDQFIETYLVHHPEGRKKDIKAAAKAKTIELLDYVNLDAGRVMSMYPHELSGGMKQRVMIAFSLLLDPKLIILDEPTTALDVITQGYIFKILKRINREFGITMLLLTHDIGVVAEFADYVGVMYGGKLMEFGTTWDVFKLKWHPYSDGLIRSTPSLFSDIASMTPIPGSPPDLRALPPGCIFHPRCPKSTARCRVEEPIDHVIGEHLSKCHLMEVTKP